MFRGSPVGYIDESIHDSAGLYVMALVIADPAGEDEARRLLGAVVPAPRAPHWCKEDETTRRKLLDQVDGLDLEARVYACRFDRPKRQEAARARALTWMIQEIEEVRHLVLDSRAEAQNAVDRRLLRALSGRPPRFGFEHRRSAECPLLWIADIVAGSVAADLVGSTQSNQLKLINVLSAVEQDWLETQRPGVHPAENTPASLRGSYSTTHSTL